jgi:hypothetical protein
MIKSQTNIGDVKESVNLGDPVVKNQINLGGVKGSVYLGDPAMQKVDSVVNSLLSELSLLPVKPISSRERRVPSKVVKKIQHNNLVTQTVILSQYKAYSASIETAYQIVDSNIINGKDKVFLILDDLYIKALADVGIDLILGEIDMEIIRKNADDIIRTIVEGLKKFCYESANVPSDKESVEIGVNIVVAHAFVECTVLENPNAPI